MSNPNVDSEKTAPPAKKSKLLKIILICGGAAFLLLVAAWFFATSSYFIKSFILPKVGAAIGAEVTAGSVALSPFSELALKDLSVRTTGADPLVSAGEVRVRYSLSAILKGNYLVDEVTLANGSVNIVQKADGTSNLDPILKKLQETPASSKPASEAKGPMQLAVRNAALKQFTVKWSQESKDGARQTAEVRDINVTADLVQNGQPGKLSIAALTAYAKTFQATNDSVQGKITGALDYALDANLMPKTLGGNIRVSLAQATGAMRDAAGLDAILECQASLSEIQKLALRFERQGKAMGQLAVSGPFDRTTRNAKLNIAISSIDRQVLGLVAPALGYDFGSTVLSTTNQVELTQGAQIISAAGRLTCSQFSLRQKDQSTPVLDLSLDYQTTVDLGKKSALVQRLSILGKQGPADLLTASLDQPMNLSWGAAAGGYKDAALKLALNNLNLADWAFLAPAVAPAGRLSIAGQIGSQKDGQQLGADLKASLDGFSARLDSNIVQLAQVRLECKGQLENLNKLSLSALSLSIADGGQPLATANGTLQYDLKTGDLDTSQKLTASLAGLLKKYSLPILTASDGAFSFDGSARMRQGALSVTGKTGLAGFTGSLIGYPFKQYTADADIDADMKASVLTIKKAVVQAKSGGTADITGTVDMAKMVVTINYAGDQLTEQALAPFLDPYVGAGLIKTATVTAKGSFVYDPAKEMTVKTDGSITNLTLGAAAAKRIAPMATGVKLDMSLQRGVLDIRQSALALTPTARAANLLSLQGKVDMSKSNAISGKLTLSSDSLDAAPLFALYQSMAPATNAAASTSAEKGKTAAPVAPAAAPSEPAAANLPLNPFSMEIAIGKLYLDEIAITNLQLAAVIQTNTISISPARLNLNGTPIEAQATLNLGVPGYIYDVTAKSGLMAIGPLSDAFMPETRGQYAGNLSVDLQIKGAGVTGSNLQKNLGGRFNMVVTNANVALLSPRVQFFVTPISYLLNVPELRSSPLDAVYINGTIQDGNINVTPLKAYAPAFRAESTGRMVFAPVLTNSTIDMPVTLLLLRSLAEKTKLVSSAEPTNTAFVTLPSFVKVAGTFGAPDLKIDKMALASMGLKSIANIPGIGEQAQGALGGLNSALSGDKAGITNALQSLVPGLLKKNPSASNTIQSLLATNTARTNINTGSLTNKLMNQLTNSPGDVKTNTVKSLLNNLLGR